MSEKISDRYISRAEIEAQKCPDLFKNILSYLKENEIKQEQQVIVPKEFNLDLSVETIFKLYSQTGENLFGYNGFIIDDFFVNYKKRTTLPQEKSAELSLKYKTGHINTYFFEINKDDTVKKQGLPKFKI